MAKCGRRGIFYEHAWAFEIKGQVPPVVCDSYYKFEIDRDLRDKSCLSTPEIGIE